ncbi:MAG: cyanophycinase, partial [Bacteroidetes bacterium]
MTRLGFIITLLGFICFACNSSHQQEQKQEQEEHSKGALFIIGGGSRPAELVERMINESGLREGGYAVVLPMSSSLPDSAIIWSSEQ